MRLVFMGTPRFAVPPLAALVDAGFAPLVVYAQPDRPAGRGRRPAAPPVKVWADAHGLPVRQPEDANAPASLAFLRDLAPDLVVVVAYGCILSPELLAVPRLGAVNLHGSLLPDYRGASPIACAILDGRTETGVTTLWMDEGIDTGDVILARATPIGPEESAGELAGRLADLGAALLAETVAAIADGTAPRTPQPRVAGRYCRKLRKEDGELDWSESAESLARRVRAMTPWPAARTDFLPEDGPARRQTLVVERAWPAAGAGGEPGRVTGVTEGVRVACGAGSLELLTVRPAGKRSMRAADWWRGLRVAGGRFVSPGTGG